MAYNDIDAPTRANQLYELMIAGEDLDFPDIDLDDSKFTIPGTDLNEAVSKLSNSDLTEKSIEGNGTFDVVLKALSVQLKAEREAERITGGEYTKAYIAMMEAALGNSVQFLINRDQAYWNAQTAQIQAITALIKLEEAKIDFKAKAVQAKQIAAQFALTKLQLSNAEEQRELIQEQVETQRSQTMDERRDGTIVTGSVGKQKDLYNQQITSYQRDAEVKATKVFADAWTVQKTVDEGLEPPDGFINANLDKALAKLLLNNFDETMEVTPEEAP